MKLKKLLSDISYTLLGGDEEQEVSALVYDSRKVTDKALFVCLKGLNSDGHAFIRQAVEDGAAAILVEDAPDFSVNAAVIQVEDTRAALAQISAAWFDYPARSMTMIGLTGTKGKTSTAHMIKGILEEAGKKVGMIGTLGAYIGNEKLEVKNTTPESYELHSLFSRMREEGCQFVVMEVSSQGLKQKRTKGIIFDYAAFLNISPDHIGVGEHADFEEYLACKRLLLSQAEHTILNIDDDHWRTEIDNAKNPITISLKEQADFMGKNIQNIWEPGLLGSSFRLEGELEGELALNMPGSFNVENALIAIAVTSRLGIGFDDISAGLRKVSVKGRTQLLSSASHFTTILIDYAHNALSMESLLKMLKEYQPGRLICLFGGGGNKPKQRRYDMGLIAGKYADLTIITMDNPRFEDMKDINAHIIEGLNVHGGNYKIIDDREEAIHYLIDNCGRDDVVALIGKGHEEYQEVRGVKYYFSEEKVVEEYLKTK